MKKLTLTLLLLFGLATVAGAQVPSPFSIYGGGLLSFPNAPTEFKDAYKNGFHGMVGIGYKAAPIAQLVGKAEFHHFGFDASQLDGVSSGAQSVWMYGADLRVGLNLPASPIKPYVLGGVGLARVSFAQFEGTNLALTTAMNSSLPEAQNKLYYNFGGGLEFNLAPMASFFAQLRYVRISTDNEPTSFVPLTLGLKLF